MFLPLHSPSAIVFRNYFSQQLHGCLLHKTVSSGMAETLPYSSLYSMSQQQGPRAPFCLSRQKEERERRGCQAPLRTAPGTQWSSEGLSWVVLPGSQPFRQHSICLQCLRQMGERIPILHWALPVFWLELSDLACQFCVLYLFQGLGPSVANTDSTAYHTCRPPEVPRLLHPLLWALSLWLAGEYESPALFLTLRQDKAKVQFRCRASWVLGWVTYLG